MAYTAITVQVPTIAGTEPTYTAATLTDGDDFLNSGKEFIHVVNGGGSPCVVTVPTPATVKGLAVEDKTVSVPAGEERMIGRFDPGLYNQSGRCRVEYDQVTTVTVAVFR